MKKIFYKQLLLIIIFFVLFLTSYKIFFQGLYPFPGNLLVSYNFPWSSGGWQGYDSWTTHKEQFAADSIRQTIPWISLWVTQIKNHSIPLWNPYSATGNWLLANPQAFVFGLFNILFFIFPLFNAWIILILIQIPLAILFTYLFCRSLGLKKPPSVFAGIAYAFSTYFLYWLEIAVIGHTILWLPLILYSIQKLFEKFQIRYLIILIFSSVACIFAGHVQTQIYIFGIAAIYYLVKSIKLTQISQRKTAATLLFYWLIFTFLITSIQLIPMLEIYRNSPLTLPLSKAAFEKITMPFVNLLTLFAPDFYGNPATNNFWANQYGDGTPNIGILPFFFAIFALTKIKKWEVKFFLAVSILFILFATRSLLYLLIGHLNLPLITGTTPVRSLFMLTFALAMLAAFGLEAYLSSEKQTKKFYQLTLLFVSIFLGLFLATLILPKLTQDKTLWLSRMSITRHNLILPFLIFLSLPFGIFLQKIVSRIKHPQIRFDILIILSTTIIGGVYQYNKISQFSKKEDFFPNHPILEWVQRNASINRVYGAGVSHLGTNFALYYQIYTPEEYNAFRIRRYGELIASQYTGKVPQDYERADAVIGDSFTNNQKRLLDLIGTRYLFSKDDFARIVNNNQDYDKPNDNVNLVWQSGKFKIYERQEVLPRFFLSSNYIIAKNDQDILNHIYDNNFDLKTLILEQNPPINIETTNNSYANLISYQPNSIDIKVNTNANTLLFLSDAFYNGWNAYVDDNKTEILRTDYALRSVAIPKGEHDVKFKFEPMSFFIGLYISAISICIFAFSVFLSIKKKKF